MGDIETIESRWPVAASHSRGAPYPGKRTVRFSILFAGGGELHFGKRDPLKYS